MSLTTFEVQRSYENDKLIPAHRVFQFPGGETHIDFNLQHLTQVAYVTSGNSVDIVSLAMWADACNRHGCESIACIPYLPGARMDRGVPLGAKVYADMINAMNIDRVIAVDPHSDVAPALYNNLTITPLTKVLPIDVGPIDGVIAPDFGAIKRAETAAKFYDVPVIQAGKHRDFATGKLSGFWCDTLPVEDGTYLLVDDICDGGGTFNGLASEIFSRFPNVKLNLWVTHGIFSQGLGTLTENFDSIFTTDSHDGACNYLESSFYKRVPILTTMLESTGRFIFP